jgi:hypothetical protein
MQPANKAQGLFELGAKIPARFMIYTSLIIDTRYWYMLKAKTDCLGWVICRLLARHGSPVTTPFPAVPLVSRNPWTPA